MFLIFAAFSGRVGAQDLSQRLRAALISSFPRRMRDLDAYLSSYDDFRGFAFLMCTAPTHFWTLQYRNNVSS